MLPAEAPLGICPACLLRAGAERSSAAMSDITDSTASGAPLSERPRLDDEAAFGTYRIVKLLGRGGMGEVYEAVADDGRRVALKLLRRSLSADGLREQFLREGALAASVTDPHCVYVYGSEEVDGVPVISMELAPLGTLKARIDRNGAESSGVAVDYIIQVIEGLKAAAASGILHRDVKPSNCFIVADGTIKIGDFGLSMSLDSRRGDIHWPSAFQGTPEYAAPEQLRGQPLDVRADIYGVGATLFFLLTGYAPFRERNMERLIALKELPKQPSPAELRPGIPKALSTLIARCLSPDPNRRPQTYAELLQLLRPFPTSAPTPASLSSRLLAGLIDGVIVAVAALPAGFLMRGWAPSSPGSLAWTLGHLCVIAYFSLCEWRFGATPGKQMCGLRVIDFSGRSPAIWRAMARWALLNGPNALVVLSRSTYGPGNTDGFYTLLSAVTAIFQIVSLLFARSRPDVAMFHDLWTGTRVIDRVPTVAPPLLVPEPGPALDIEPVEAARIGPFEVLGRIGRASDSDDVLLARDARLQRFVWIHRHEAREPLPLERKELAQPSRLRWLLGASDWNAFEAPDGRALLTLAPAPQTWNRIMTWLLQLSRDLDDAKTPAPPLSLDRVWITNDGRVMLLEFPAPGLDGDRYRTSSFTSVPAFLSAVADAAAGEHRLDAFGRSAVDALRRAQHDTAWAAYSILASSSESAPDPVRWRRAVPIVLCALPAMAGAGGAWNAPNPDRQEIVLRLATEEISQRSAPGLDDATAGAMLQYVADEFRGKLAAAPDFWTTLDARTYAPYRPAIEWAIARHPPVDATATSTARQVTERRMQPRLTAYRAMQSEIARYGRGTLAAWAAASAMIPFALLSLAIALYGAVPAAFRASKYVLLDAAGNDATRVRLLVRAAVTWSPLLILIAISYMPEATEPTLMRTIIDSAPIALIAAGAVYAIAFPVSAIQDKVAGTYLARR